MFSGLNELWGVHDVVRLFDAVDYDAPRNWQHYKIVKKAFNQAFDDASRIVPDWKPSLTPIDRGITICGGGWRFFPSVYVTVRVIRETGCTLPIQVWYLGDRREFDPRMKQATDRFNVEWVDGQAFAREHQIKKRQWGGWQLKSFAALHSPFKEVICLDADCYPIYNPEIFLDSREHQTIGATFWPDIGSLTKQQWEQFDMEYRDEPAFESGQFVVDKSRHYGALWLSDWMNNRSDYVYSHIYGDKDTFHLAWRKLDQPYCMPKRIAEWHFVGFTHRDFQNNIIFFHRVADKFKWDGKVDDVYIDRNYPSQQNIVPKFLPSLPLEKECHRWVVECSEIVRPDQHLTYPAGSNMMNKHIWDSVVLGNEYDLPNSMKGMIVIDIGANYGAFSLACIYRDVDYIFAAEPLETNNEAYKNNLKNYADRYALLSKMVCDTSDGVNLPIAPFHEHEGHWSTSLFTKKEGETRLWNSIHIDDLIDLASEKGEIDLMKIDAEGAEFPALMASTKLRKVKRIVGECHDFGFEYRGKVRTIEDVIQALTDRGFVVRHFKTGVHNPKHQTHLFFADRS